ncbi:c-type cytochrome [Reichenbachiella sp. MALMAid0571]|uniref:c-type cytochrome n=1 Tax=Reichenbachiella sp. MALMAid0571 TaxID=3143939 RepID=UPI0032DEBBBB
MRTPYLLLILISVFFSCSKQKVKKNQIRKTERKELNALETIVKNDCLHCHSIEDKVVGPPYLDIARRHQHNPEMKSVLGNKIIEGGGGLWYGGMMSGHPLLKKKEVNLIVDWILSLDKKRSHQLATSKKSNLTSIFQQQISPSDSSKIKMEVFKLEQIINNFSAFDKTSKPDFTGFADEINLLGDEAFFPLKPPYLLKVTGNLEVKLGGKHFFRLAKEGSGQIYLDGKSIISNTETDNEIVLDIEPGQHPFTIYYSGVGKSDTLSFSWITPGAEYYSLVQVD